jgi:hypothetical protein
LGVTPMRIIKPAEFQRKVRFFVPMCPEERVISGDFLRFRQRGPCTWSTSAPSSQDAVLG